MILRLPRAALVIPGLGLLALMSCSAGGTDPPGAAPAGASGGAAGSAGGSGAEQALADCKQACVTVDGLQCPQTPAGECGKVCDSSARVKGCAGEFAAYSACAKEAEWKCEGFAQVAACADVQKKLLTCLTDRSGGSGVPGEPGNFFCNKTACDGSPAERACCLKLDLMKLGVEAKCVSSIDQCGEDSRWECDGPDDCGGKACCWSNPSNGSGQTVLGFCRDSCNPLAGEREVCQDRCSTGLYCCKKPGEDIGNCEQSKEICDAKPDPMQ